MPILERPYIYNISGILKGKRKERLYNTTGVAYVDAPEISNPRDAMSYVVQNDDEMKCFLYKEHEGKIYQPYQEYMSVFYGYDAKLNNPDYPIYGDIIKDCPIDFIVVELSLFNEDKRDATDIERFAKTISHYETSYYDKDAVNIEPDAIFKSITSDNQKIAEKAKMHEIGDCIITRENLKGNSGQTECLWKSTDLPSLRIQPSTLGANIPISLKKNEDKKDGNICFPVYMMDAAWKYAELLGQINDTKPYLDSRLKAISLNPDVDLQKIIKATHTDDEIYHNIVMSVLEYKFATAKIKGSTILKLCDEWNNFNYENIDDFKEIIKHYVEQTQDAFEKRDLLYLIKNLDCLQKAINYYLELQQEDKLSNYLDEHGPKKKEYVIAPQHNDHFMP